MSLLSTTVYRVSCGTRGALARAARRGVSAPLRIVTGALILAVLIGCGGSSEDQSLVRALNAYVPATGADPTVSLTANSTLVDPNGIAFGQFANAGAFTTIPSGVLTAQGTGPGVAGTLQLANATALFGNRASYMIVATGQAGQTGARAPQLLVLPDFGITTLALTSTTSAIRVVNLSLNPRSIGLYTTTNGVPSGALATAFASVAYGYDTSSTRLNSYISVTTSLLTGLALVDTSAPTVKLTLSSTSNLTSFTFQPGRAYTLYIYGQPGNTAQPLGATWVQDFPTF